MAFSDRSKKYRSSVQAALYWIRKRRREADSDELPDLPPGTAYVVQDGVYVVQDGVFLIQTT